MIVLVVVESGNNNFININNNINIIINKEINKNKSININYESDNFEINDIIIIIDFLTKLTIGDPNGSYEKCCKGFATNRDLLAGRI